MKTFEESDRLNYPLDADSVIVEVGSHEGWFAGELWLRFGAHMCLFEPIPEFWNKCMERFKDNPKVVVLPYALGGADRVVSMGKKGDMTGEYCSSPNSHESVFVKDALTTLRMLAPEGIDLLSINAEGAEYEILDRLIAGGDINRARNISVQFHTVVPDYEARYAAIIECLKETHDHVYGSPFIWDGFTLR